MKPQIYAHRGGAGLMPENTLPAYKKAMEIGVDAVDMDVGMSKDGVVMVAHDPVLLPEITKYQGHWLPDVSILLKDKTATELAEYDVGQMKRWSLYGLRHLGRKNIPNTPMPRLQEVIAFVKQQPGSDQVKFQIEIKTRPNAPDQTFSPEDILRAVVKVVQAEGVSDRTEIHSFDWRALKELPMLAPEITPSYLTSTSWAGYDRKSVLDFRALLAEMKSLGAKVWCPGMRDLLYDPRSPEYVDLAHELGLRVVVWTVNSPGDMKRLIKWGVDGLITDYPDRLKRLLEAS